VQSGQILDVPDGGDLEQAIGLPNLTPLSGTELDAAQQGSAWAVSN
jgi:hypothetical protein